MNAHLDTTPFWVAVYEVRDQHGQLIHQEYPVQVQAKNRMDAMMAAVDKVLDETKAPNAVCRGCRRV